MADWLSFMNNPISQNKIGSNANQLTWGQLVQTALGQSNSPSAGAVNGLLNMGTPKTANNQFGPQLANQQGQPNQIYQIGPKQESQKEEKETGIGELLQLVMMFI